MTEKTSIYRRLMTRCCGAMLLGVGLAVAIGFALAFYGGAEDGDMVTGKSAALYPDTDSRMQDITRILLAEQGAVLNDQDKALNDVEPAAGK